jgi:hypothetical protein
LVEDFNQLCRLQVVWLGTFDSEPHQPDLNLLA